jgi:hypothetical protein
MLKYKSFGRHWRHCLLVASLLLLASRLIGGVTVVTGVMAYWWRHCYCWRHCLLVASLLLRASLLIGSVTAFAGVTAVLVASLLLLEYLP